jgi:signal transduction histidine kinase/ligand-binding sensor protein
VEPFVVACLSDLVPAEVLQALETGVGARHHIPLFIAEPDGDQVRYITPVPDRTHHSRLCRLMRSAPGGEGLCETCGDEAVRELMADGPGAAPRWMTCRMGLSLVAAPIVVADKVVAVLASGEHLLPEIEEALRARIPEIADALGEVDPADLADAAAEMEVLSEAQQRRLEERVAEHAAQIARLGQDRYDLERRLRQTQLLYEVMIELSRPCHDIRDLETRLTNALQRVTDFFRLAYSTIFTQTFSRSPEMAAVACAGACEDILTVRLAAPPVPEPAGQGPTHRIVVDRDEIRAFLSHDAGPEGLRFRESQAIICDYGDPGERISLTVFGPHREGHTESLLSTAGDDFLERFHFEVGMRSRVTRLLLELQRADADKTQFLAQTTHEINAGLQTIVEESEWLQYYVDEMAHIDDPEITEPLKKILSEVLRLGARARMSLFHLRGGMPRAEYKLHQAHPLDRLISAAVDPFRTVAASRNITFNLDDSLRRLPHARFDWEMMKTVFMNLVDNAVKYSHYNRTVRIYGEADERGISVSVQDFGLGIPPEEYDRIFEPYVRGSQRDPRRFIWGSGLGLAVARDIANTHGGTIEVKSTPTAKEPVADPARAWENHITTVTVRLPLRQEE